MIVSSGLGLLDMSLNVRQPRQPGARHRQRRGDISEVHASYDLTPQGGATQPPRTIATPGSCRSVTLNKTCTTPVSWRILCKRTA